MEDIANSFLEDNTDNFYNIATKYKNIVENKLIDHKLKEFRRSRSKKLNVPAYYVFTDEEMNKLIINKPKSIDDLKDILPEIKIKCHGKQIIKLINE